MLRASKIPLLTPDEEIFLGRRTQALMALLEEKPKGPYSAQEQGVIRKGRRARDRMIVANIRLVAVIAGKYNRTIPQASMGLDDLMQEGVMGLVRGVEKFDPERGYKLSTYVYWWIRQGITRSLHNNSRMVRLPGPLSEKAFQQTRVYMTLTQTLGRHPTRAEMAEGLDMKLDDYERLLSVGASHTSLDVELTEDGNPLIDVIAGGSDSAEQLEQVSASLNSTCLKRAMTFLSDKEAQLIHMRYGLEGSEEFTLGELGEKMGVSRERIRQVQAKALNKLRHRIRGAGQAPALVS